MNNYDKMLPMINRERLENIKLFEENSIKFTDDNLIIGTVRRNYVLVYSPIKDVRRILFKYTTKIIYNATTKKRFYSIPAPTKYQERNLFFRYLDQLEIKPITNFYVNATDSINTRNTKNGFALRKLHWKQRLELLSVEINKTVQFLTYDKPKNPLFPLFYPQDNQARRTLAKHIKYYAPFNNDIYNFYFYALRFHLYYSTGMNHQHYTDTIIAKQKDIRSLLPQDFTIEKLLTFSNQNTEITKQTGKALAFKFNMENVQKNNTCFEHNYKLIPMYLINKLYNKTKNILLMLILLYPAHSLRRTFKLKLSNLIALANLEESMKNNGIPYIVRKLNSCFKYCSEDLGFLKPIEITKEDIKQDKAIEISHTCYLEKF